MPTGERTKELSFRLWVEGKSVAENTAADMSRFSDSAKQRQGMDHRMGARAASEMEA
jgi:hypothetical protein